ncbi:MAG: hypothetical protein IPG04_17080 [Polyangiaceae bacterium]|nr:hypothetical protein [Polyangiaceae bacterium]
MLYTLEEDGDSCITKKLERGTFLLPAVPEGERYVVLKASMVGSLFPDRWADAEASAPRQLTTERLGR